jgi:lipopolysaccharide/colanic/teichoic acid biosynthesis glycosyltransferase
MKRLFDFIVSLFSMVLLFPLGILISICIILDSKGPIFFKQVRVGKNSKTFKIFKFRTMIVDAEKEGLQLTVGQDPRITRVGYILRKYKIDELPQIINVLFGEMSFVGPRPEVPRYVELYTEEQKTVLTVRPGITDLASIEFINENEILNKSENPEQLYINEVLPKKLELNKKYVEKSNLSYDIKIIFKTLIKIVSK